MVMKTDAQVQKNVIAELNWDPEVDASKIAVEVTYGVVTLSGQVDSHSEKSSAERAVLRVNGVLATAIETEVEVPKKDPRKDADIAQAAESILHKQANFPKDTVQVMVEDGWITLTGNVDWEYQRHNASNALRNLIGVAGVNDHITLKHPISLTEVKMDIEVALKRRAKHEAKKIQVTIQGGEVTLTGSVTSGAERDLAIDSSKSATGVLSVKDDISVQD